MMPNRKRKTESRNMKKKTNFAALFSGKKKIGLFSLGGKKKKKAL